MKKNLLKIAGLVTVSVLFLNITSCRESDEVIEYKNDVISGNKSLADRVIAFRNIQESSNLLQFKSYSSNVNYNNLEKNATFYHQLKLKSIYLEREKFNFTSLQNLADEINSLKLINNKQSDLLFQQYSNFLRKSIYIVEPNINYDQAIITDIKGLKNPESNNSIQKYIGVASVKEGILLTNGLYSITWHVGVEKHQDDLGSTFYRNFTQIGSNVYLNGQWVLYPSSMRPSLDAYADFYGASITHKETLGFLSDYGSVIRNTGQKTSYMWAPKNARIGGTFTTTVNGAEYKLEGATNFSW